MLFSHWKMHIHSLMQHAALFPWLTCLTVATPLHEHQIHGLLQPDQQLPQKKRQVNSGSYLVTGVQDAGIAPRPEIRQLQKSSDMLNIFLLGLARFHATPQDDEHSYYQICAVHGRPYGDFDGVGSANGTENNGSWTHVSNLLLPLRRPYLALFEQILFECIVECVNEFPAGELRDRYAQAALLVRLPFWDWAVKPENGSVLPEIVQQPLIKVIMPNGTATIYNPVYSYEFNDVSHSDMFFDPFASWTETKSYPTVWVSNATSQNDKIAPQLDNQQVSVADRIYNLLTFYTNFTQLSNEAWVGNEKNIDSIEALHDIIHGVMGNDGHMTYLDFSAFDLIFWMHHVCLDRFFDIGLILPNDSYVEPMAAMSATYTIAVYSIQDADSPLEPFSRDSAGTKWTPNTVKDTTTFGYTYPETQTGIQADTIAEVNRLYGAGYNGGGPLRSRDIAAAVAEAQAAAGSEIDGRQRQYAANLLSNKHALNGTYAIYVFVGDFDNTDPCSWPISPNLAGTHVAFGSMYPDKDVVRPPIVTGGTVPLTNILINKVSSSEFSSLEEDDVQDYVQDYIEKNLHWGTAQFDDKSVSIDDISNLEITVSVSEVTPPSNQNEFPTREGFKKLTRVTQGKKGGC